MRVKHYISLLLVATAFGAFGLAALIGYSLRAEQEALRVSGRASQDFRNVESLSTYSNELLAVFDILTTEQSGVVLIAQRVLVRCRAIMDDLAASKSFAADPAFAKVVATFDRMIREGELASVMEESTVAKRDQIRRFDAASMSYLVSLEAFEQWAGALAERQAREVAKHSDRARLRIMAYGILFLVGVFLLRWWITVRLVLPLGNLSQAAVKAMSQGQDFALEPSGPSEIRSLTSSVKAFIESLEDKITERTIELADANLELNEKNKEAESRSRELQNQKFALDAHAIVSIADVAGDITYVNDKFCDLSGYSCDELIGQNHRMVKSDEHPPEFYRELWSTISKGKVWHGEIKNRCKDGSHYWVGATIVPFKGADGKIEQYVAIRTDLTNVKEAERQAKAANAELANANAALETARSEAALATRAKSEFLANMSHEIRTPMTAILGFTENLREGGLSGSEERDAIETIYKNGEYLLGIINDILDMSKIEAGKMTVERIDCSVFDLIAEVIELMKGRSDAKGLSLKAEFIGVIPETIQTDPTRLRQILINVTGNAVKFTQQGGIRILVRFLSSKDRPQMQIDIIDSGIGMTDVQANTLFEAFTQADTTTTRKFGGTGLGLTISKRLAELLGGDLGVVDTKPGLGTRFRVTVATGLLENVRILHEHQFAPRTEPNQSPKTASAVKLPRCRILLAEDGYDNQRLIAFILKKAGADVTTVENGKLALDAALLANDAHDPFDVILMDMLMPVMDGYAATVQLRLRGHTRPIIALTANAMATDREKCLKAGCDDYATKPINRKTLIKVIRANLTAGENVEPSHKNEPDALVPGGVS